MSHKAVFGVDIGGTKLRVGLVDEHFEIVDALVTQDHCWLSPHEMLDFVVAQVTTLRHRYLHHRVLGCGVGYPGPINFFKGTTFSYSNLRGSGWEGVSLSNLLSTQINLPVWIDNDANLAGLAEVYFGAGQGFSHCVYLTISTGLGGAIFVDGKLYRGFLGYAGEFGHMVVDSHGAYCKCGNRGCLMSLLSGLGIEKLVQEDPACRFIFTPEENPTLCVQKLVELAARGDRVALEVIQPLIQYLQIAFLNVIEILNPEVIVVGGSLGKALLRHFVTPVEEYLLAHLPIEVVKHTVIREARLGDYNGVLGGALLAFQELEKGGEKDKKEKHK